MSDKDNHTDKITHLTPEMMQRYRLGKLSPIEQHAVEKYLLDNPFEAEAMEGAADDKFLDDVSALQSKIAKQSNDKEDKVIPLWRRYYGIAAAITIIAVSSFIIFNLFQPEKTEQKQLAMEEKLEQSSPEIVMDTLEAANEASSDEESKKLQDDIAPTKITKASKPSPMVAQADEKTTHVPKSEIVVPEIILDEKLALNDDVVEIEAFEMADAGIAKQDVVPEQPEQEKLSHQVKNEEDVASESLPARASSKQKEVLSKRKKSSQRIVRGQITSIEDGMPLPGVNVVIKGTTTGTITDVDGFYELAMDEEDVLVYSFVGYTTEEIESGERTTIDISMYADVAQLSEVVVTGYGGETEISPSKSARPEVGYYNYRKYLKDKLVYPQQALDSTIEGKVVVEFDVTASGSLENFDIRKSLGYGCDEEAIRLIKEGPQWEVAEENGSPVSKTIRIKVKFELE